MSHNDSAIFTAHSEVLEGDVRLKEFQCGFEYVIAESDAKYCPKCGESLQ